MTLESLARLSSCICYSNKYKCYIPSRSSITKKEIYERMFLIQEYLKTLGYEYNE